jgi:hypothetical protein
MEGYTFENIKAFIDNSVVERTILGAYSCNIVYKCNEDYESPFTSNLANGRVNKIIIKLSQIVKSGEIHANIFRVPNENNVQISIQETFTNHFNNEIKMLRLVYDETIDSPLCPRLLYGQIYKNSLQLEQFNIEGNTTLNEFFKTATSKPIGIIAMEYADGYTDMFTILNELIEELDHYEQLNTKNELNETQIVEIRHESSKKIASVIVAAVFIILKLAIETEVTQGDFSNSNILFRTVEQPYFVSDEIPPDLSFIRTLRPLFIDFGNAKKIGVKSLIPPENTTDAKTLYEEYQYRKCLGNICLNGGSHNPLIFFRSFMKYNWASGIQSNMSKGAYKLLLESLQSQDNPLIFFKYYGTDLIETSLLDYLNKNVDGEGGFMHKLIQSTPTNTRQDIDMAYEDTDTNKTIQPTGTTEDTNTNEVTITNEVTTPTGTIEDIDANEVTSPTGTEIAEPVSETSAPRTMPSVGCIEIARTKLSPMCCATSSVSMRFSPLSVTSMCNALKIAGIESAGNSISTTGPITRATRPVPVFVPVDIIRSLRWLRQAHLRRRRFH